MDRFLSRPTHAVWSDASGLFWCRSEVLNQGEFCAGLELTKMDLIHEGSNEKDAATGAAEEILRSQGIGKLLPVHAFALVGDGKNQGFAVVLEAGRNLFGGIVVVAMEDGIYSGFADRHGDAEALILIDAGLRG